MLRAVHAVVQGIAQNPGRIARRLAAVGIVVTWNDRERRLE